jgi:hypothetical protein
MKTTILKSRLFSSMAALAIAGTVLLSACDKDDDDDMPGKNTYTLAGNASGDQEVPAVTTDATGTISGTYNKQSKQLSYTINWTGLSGDITAAHFHGPAAPGESAGPIQDIAITTNGTSGSTSATITASDELHTALLDGKVYYNLHTAAKPDGEIRGQVSLNQ